jgi:hypothetical protein
MKYFALFAFLLFAAACGTKELRPTDLLERDVFKGLLVEAQLIEARVNREMTVDKRQDIPVKQYYVELFKQKDVTAEAFHRTFQWYAEHPEELKAVYADVLTELQLRSDTIPH